MWINEFVIACVYYIKQLTAFIWEKIILSFIIWLLLLFIDVYHAQEIAITALFWLTILDFILWFWRAVYNHKLESWKLKLWVWKFIIYWLALLTWYWLDNAIFKTHIERWLEYVFALYLSLTEWISVLEHLAEMWVKLPFLKILKKTQRQLEDMKDIKDIVDFITKKK